MGYKIDEVSRELGVSEKSIFKRIKDKDFKKYIYISNGTIYIKDEGIKYILDNASKEEMYIENITRIKEIEDIKNNEIIYLHKEIEILKLEKEHAESMLNLKDELLVKKDIEINKLKEKIIEMKGLEERYNKLYGKMSELLKDKGKEKKKRVKRSFFK